MPTTLGLPPGPLSAYLGVRNANQDAGLNTVQQGVGMQGILAKINAAQKDRAFRNDLNTLGPNPTNESLVQIASKYAGPKDIMQFLTEREKANLAAKKGSLGQAWTYTIDDKGKVLRLPLRPEYGQPEYLKVDGQQAVRGSLDPITQKAIAGSKEYGKKIGGEVSDAGRSIDADTSIKEAANMLDKGIYTGFWANIQKTGVKAIPGIDKTKAANTEQFISHIGNVVIPRLKEFGGNDTVEEMKYLQQVTAGNITMEEPALRKILQSAERKIRARQERLKRNASEIGLPVDTSENNSGWKDL